MFKADIYRRLKQQVSFIRRTKVVFTRITTGHEHFIGGLKNILSADSERQIRFCPAQCPLCRTKPNLPFSAGHMSDVRRYFKAWNQAKAIENFIDFYWQDLFERNDLQRIQIRNRQMPFWLPTYPYVRTQKIAEMKFALN